MEKTKRDLTELNKLEEYLKKHGIKYTRRDEEHTFPVSIDGEEKDVTIDKHQIVAIDPKKVQLWDVICHYGSYGADQGLLEIAGDIVEEGEGEVVGFLTADDVIKRIERKAKNDAGA